MRKWMRAALLSLSLALAAGGVSAEDFGPLTEKSFTVAAWCGDANQAISFLVEQGFGFEFKDLNGMKRISPDFSLFSEHDVMGFRIGENYCFFDDDSSSLGEYVGTFKRN